jgi:glycerol uptake facilitator-like aquaporin
LKWFSLVIGFSVLTMIYAAGYRLGERFDPAAAVNLDTAKRIPVTYLLSYGASRPTGEVDVAGFFDLAHGSSFSSFRVRTDLLFELRI